MKDLINMVLDVRKMEVGETKLKLQAYPFNSWIKEIGADFTDEGAAQEVQIDYQLDDSIKEVVFDKGMCTIVVTNLLTNALKHSPKNTTVTIRTSKNDSYVRFGSGRRYARGRHGESIHPFLSRQAGNWR